MEPVACLAGDLPRARAGAREIWPRLPGATLRPASISGYLARLQGPRRVVLCAAGRSPQADLDFLRLAARSLVWPAPTEDFQDAIGGLRTKDARPRRAGSPGSSTGARGLATALLLEGRVGPARARAALRSSAARHWIVESPRQVRISEALRRELDRAGVRWAALEPIEVVGIYVSPALARSRAKWKGLFPARTRVWISKQ